MSEDKILNNSNEINEHFRGNANKRYFNSWIRCLRHE